jgi:spermidine synthase
MTEASRAPGRPDFFLAGTVFVTGAAVLVVEIAGARVLAPYYGSGLYSWTAMIAVAMAALAVGYAMGGRAADRRPDPSFFFGLILLAGVLVLIIPWLGGAIIRATAPLGPRTGVTSASLLLFFPSLSLLGVATPFAIRLARPAEGVVGSVSGRLFAISTAGSLIAAVATGFLLLPNLGVKTILVGVGLALVALAVAGLVRARARGAVPAALILAVTLVLGPGLARPPEPRSFRVLERTPSFYGLIRVVEGPTMRVLTVDGVGQNYIDLAREDELAPYLAFFAAMPRMHRRTLGPPRRALVVGLGAGQLVRQLERAGLTTEVVEIDSRIAETARRWFGFDLPAERVHLMDGRVFLEHDTSPPYDYIVLDAFLGDEAPWHLFTVEALRRVRERLAPEGAVLLNYTAISGGREFEAVSATLRRVFPHVRGFTEGPRGELAGNVFVASDSPIELDREPLAFTRDAGTIGNMLGQELPPGPGTVLTDDHNPISLYRLAASQAWRASMREFLGADWEFLSDF